MTREDFQKQAQYIRNQVHAHPLSDKAMDLLRKYDKTLAEKFETYIDAGKDLVKYIDGRRE